MHLSLLIDGQILSSSQMKRNAPVSSKSSYLSRKNKEEIVV